MIWGSVFWGTRLVGWKIIGSGGTASLKLVALFAVEASA
jgi:hypothetical protein